MFRNPKQIKFDMVLFYFSENSEPYKLAILYLKLIKYFDCTKVSRTE